MDQHEPHHSTTGTIYNGAEATMQWLGRTLKSDTLQTVPELYTQSTHEVLLTNAHKSQKFVLCAVVLFKLQVISNYT